MLRDDVAMADAPIVLKTHQANAALAGERRCLRQRELTFRFDQARLVDAAHGFGVATARRLASQFRRAERLYVNVADAGFSKAGGEHMFGKARAARVGDLAHVHQRFHFRGAQRCDEVGDADALVTDGPKTCQVRNPALIAASSAAPARMR